MILVVEDNPAISAIFAEAVRGAGYQVEVVATAGEGLRRLAQGDVELALIDLSLPDFNGAELAERVRAAGIATPMIVVSGAMPLVDEARHDSAGFVERFAKPLRISALIEAIERRRRRAASP